MFIEFGILALSFVLVSLASGLVALAVISALDTRRNRTIRGLFHGADDQVVFLFDDETLIDATPQARQFLSVSPTRGSDWMQLSSLLLPRFPNFTSEIGSLAENGSVTMLNEDKSTRLRADWRRGLARIVLENLGPSSGLVEVDRHSIAAMEYELESLRSVGDEIPFLVWRETADGTVTWANRAYLNLADAMDPHADVRTWPPARLFECPRSGPGNKRRHHRLSVRMPDCAGESWYDIRESALGEEWLFTGVSADDIVKAEQSLRDFIQTLSKTFAHLTIGLAVFDRKRQLTLFNPALTDLTALPIDFLSARPSLTAFLDQLREHRMMPEPKDYKSWRQQIVELEAAATDGSFCDTWSMPTGQTYRVTGRPHPDGAIAFLFEDISAEISLTRRFRAELETGQAVIDSLDEAIAVFSPSGALVLSNAAYEEIWGCDPSSTLSDTGVAEATRRWHRICQPTPVWGDFRDFVGGYCERSEWTAEVRRHDGRPIQCRFVPIGGGATLAGFTLAAARPLLLERLARMDALEA